MQTAPVYPSAQPALAALLGLTLGLATSCFPLPPDTAAPPTDVTTAPETEAVDPDEQTTTGSESTRDEPRETAIAPEDQAEVAAASSAAMPAVDTFTTNELFAAGGGGCGMSLWRADAEPREEGFLFFSGLEGSAMMRFDGELVALERDETTGEEFYGQYTSQTFVAPDDSLSATANVVLGEPGEIESVAIPAGTLLIQAGSATTEIPVTGDAGC